MATLSTKVKLYLEANGKVVATEQENKTYRLVNKGEGDIIQVWTVSGLAQPTEEQLNAFESQGNDLEAEDKVIMNRKNEYPSIQDLVVALYDTDDRAAIDAKRAEIKLKHPKGV